MTRYLPLALAYVLGVLAVARATRLLTSDAYPPAEALRTRWTTWTARTRRRRGWAPLLTCPFCAAPYLTAVALTWVIAAGIWSPDLTSWAGWWWVGVVWASASYLAAMIVVRDEPED